MLTSEFKGQSRIYIADVETPGEEPLSVNFLFDQEPLHGNLDLLVVKDDFAVVTYSSSTEPPKVYMLTFTNIQDCQSLKDLKYDNILLDEVKINSPELLDQVKTMKHEAITLENGAEAYFIRLGDEAISNSPIKGENGKHPMLVLLHGGPFGASPRDMFMI